MSCQNRTLKSLNPLVHKDEHVICMWTLHPGSSVGIGLSKSNILVKERVKLCLKMSYSSKTVHNLENETLVLEFFVNFLTKVLDSYQRKYQDVRSCKGHENGLLARKWNKVVTSREWEMLQRHHRFIWCNGGTDHRYCNILDTFKTCNLNEKEFSRPTYLLFWKAC